MLLLKILFNCFYWRWKTNEEGITYMIFHITTYLHLTYLKICQTQLEIQSLLSKPRAYKSFSFWKSS